MIARDANNKQSQTNQFLVLRWTPQMGSWSLKWFSKDDQLKIKLTNLKFPENDNLDLFLKIWGLEIGKGD